VVGAGPAGISMAVEGVQAGIQRVVVLEKGQEHSWAIRKFYPDQKPVTANFKGQEAICHGVMCIIDTTKAGVLSYLDQAIADHHIDVRYGETVHKIEPLEGGGFVVETGTRRFQTQVCVIAIGILGKPNKPAYAIPGALKARVHFDVTSHKITDSDVLVVGGGDSASEYVQYLHELGNRVTLSYRRAAFERMNAINRDSLEALAGKGEVSLLRSSDITGLADDGGRVRAQFVDGQARVFDHVVYALGGTTPDNFLRAIGIEFSGAAPTVGEGYETSIPGLFLIGDLSAGKKGGSIISAFNSANAAMRKICDNHLECTL